MEDPLGWINKIIDDAGIPTLENYVYYYNTLRKFALLRSYLLEGVDVSAILDLTEVDPTLEEKQLNKFNNMDINEIIDFFDRQNLNSKQRFIIRESNRSRKSGDNAQELREALKVAPCYGYGLSSEYLNTVSRGIQGNRFILETRDSGMGRFCRFETRSTEVSK